MKEIGKPCTKIQEMVEKFVNVTPSIVRSACADTWAQETAGTMTIDSQKKDSASASKSSIIPS